MEFHDIPCPWAWKSPEQNAGALTCLGGECVPFPGQCIRQKRWKAAQPDKPFKPRGARQSTRARKDTL